VSASTLRSATPPASLARLRLRLTIWYAATFAVMIALLGGALFGTITRRIDRAVDESLRDAIQQIIAAARTRDFDDIGDLHTPDRTLYLFDTTGHALTPTAAPPWVDSLARIAARAGVVSRPHLDSQGEILRTRAERFAAADGTPMVAVASAQEIELEDRYPALIAGFGTAAVLAILFGTAGGWLVARKSTEPVERTIAYMQRFMADAAHELRTPITVLRSRAEVALQQERDPSAYVSALRGIERESERMGRIVEDLLTLARADAGERHIERQRVFLDDIVLDAAGAARAVGLARGVTVEVERFDEAEVEGDPRLLRQLAMILLDNAVKFTDAGGSVHVSVGITGGLPTLAIADTGTGISAEQLPHVFERFFRGDLARTRGPSHGASESGAGLGLSIAQWIAETLGAQIRLDSTAGVGTTATVQFPAVAPSSPRQGSG
jgi:signal transduction histidine kinase